MKEGTKFLLVLLSLAAVLVLGVFGYEFLTDRYQKPEMENGGTSSVLPEDSETEGVTPNVNNPIPPNEDEVIKNTAQDFTVLDWNGNAVKLSDYYGQPIVINFWATWCGPCQSELPAFDEAYAEYGDKITFMMVNLTDGYNDTVSSVKEFVNSKGYGFPVYFDTDYSGANAYEVYSIPLTVMIDENGNVYGTHLGSMNMETLEDYLNGLLEG